MRLLRRAQLLPRCYEIDEYFADRWGSRRIVQGLRDTTLLILVDEVALLHPGLRAIAEALLSSTNNAVVSISPCDPAHTSTDELLGDLSYLRVGNIVSRFRTDLDPRCEIAVNSIDRIDRWLRATLPELVAAAGEQQGDPRLLARMERELAQ